MRDRRFVPVRKHTLIVGFALTLVGGMSAPFAPRVGAEGALLPVAAFAAALPAAAATVAPAAVELSPTPPNDTQAVAPNILVTFDDSGSMAYNYMGDDRPYDSGSWSGPWRCAGVIDPRITDPNDIRSAVMNGVYYNPNVLYLPPLYADGTSFPNADSSLTHVPQDGIGVNRPLNRKTLDTSSHYDNNPTGTVDSTRATNLIGVNTNRWICGYGSPISGGGPYYYRYRSDAPTITVNAYGKPDAAGLANLYKASNWEPVAVTNTDVTINGVKVNQWQNFANWYAYYRTRNLMTRTSLSRVFGSLGGKTPDGGFGSTVRVAWQNLNSSGFKLPAKAIISALIDTASCGNAASADPGNLQTPTDTAKPPACYRSAFFNWIFQTPANGGTPSVNATSRAGQFFQRGGSGDSNKTANYKTLRDPYWEAGKVLSDGTQAAGAELYCRQNFHMLVTDGLFNENNVAVPAAITTLPDQTVFNPSASYNAIFQTKHSSSGSSGTEASLSDLAFYYWATNLRPDLYDPPNGKFVPPYLPDTTTGVVPTTDISAASANSAHVNNEIYFNPKNDPANWPHLVQYMVGLGVSGVLNYSDDTDCSVSTSSDACLLRKGSKNSSGASGWPTPSDPSPGIAANIDDTWHAALAGRGNFFNAGNPQSLVDQLSAILSNISARSAPATTGATNTSVLVPGALGFNTGYSTVDWTGTLQAVTVNADGTTSTTTAWDAGALLDDKDKTPPAGRSVFSAKEDASGNFSGGVAFKTFGDLDAAGKALISGTPASIDGTNDTGQTRIDYLRGDRSKEGTTFRGRAHLLGAIIGSQPVYVSYPSSGYRNTWPTGSPEQQAMAADDSNCGSTAPSTCHSYEYFVQDHLGRKPTVYVGANDGMLHAFDASEYEDTSTTPSTIRPTTDAGKELFAYVPRSVYANLGNLTVKSNFKFMPTVDGIPVTRDVFFSQDTTTPVATSKGWHTILVGGLRLGGRGVYALDITDPASMSAGKVLWEFNADQPDQGAWKDDLNNINPGGKPSRLGYTYGQPNIGRLANGKWVVLVPGGYFPDCSKAPFTSANCSYPAAASSKYSSLFIVDAQTGKLIREMTTPDPVSVPGAAASHGLATPVLGDYNDDQIDDVAFAGDLDGNLWRFDLSSPDPGSWSVTLAFRPATPGAQPITSMPRLFGDPATNKFMVVFGTGKYLGAGDNTSDSAATQAVYGIRDLGTTATVGNLVKQTLSEKLADDGITLARGLTNYPVPADKGGWYFNLGPSDSSKGERVVVTPGALFDTGRVVIQTLIPGTNDPCSASIQGAVMVVNAATGGSAGGLSGPAVAGWGGTGAGDTSTVGGRVSNPRTNGTVPLATSIGGGTVLIPGLKLTGGSVLNINDAVWRRRSWREVDND